jgi:hypothetical protein
MGCEIWVAITAAGEAAHYLLRLVMSNGTKGLWSETVSATIVG